mmetsp:Transcript_31779/g.51105  ORF Transcript_31779/g.51105 Transcript_31779/m.51105 type:complete len:95 (+) Transcript_31779:89-373(+)
MQRSEARINRIVRAGTDTDPEMIIVACIDGLMFSLDGKLSVGMDFVGADCEAVFDVAVWSAGRLASGGMCAIGGRNALGLISGGSDGVLRTHIV